MFNKKFRTRVPALALAAAACFSLFTGCAGQASPAGSSSTPSSGPPTVAAQSYGFGQPGRLNSIGNFTPDSVYDIFPEEDAAAALAEALAPLRAIAPEDMLLVEALREGYEEKTVAEFRAAFNRQVEESPGFFGAVSELTYAGIHNMYAELDDFYCSLYFALLDWCQHYGTPGIRDASYHFAYWRYLGEKQEVYTQESYDYEKLVFLGYSLYILYGDDTAITVGERDAAIAAAVGEINNALYGLTLEQWNDAGSEAVLRDLVENTLEKHGGENLAFELLQVDFLHSEELGG